MGTKGRDLAIWLFFSLMPVAIIASVTNYAVLSKVLFGLGVITSLYILWFFVLTLPKAINQSKQLNLQVVVLLPVNIYWAKILTRNIVKCPAKKAYELHLMTDLKLDLKTYFEKLDQDLVKLANSDFVVGSLVIWETPAPIPSKFRKLLKDKKAKNLAYTGKGGWGLPYPPFVSQYSKKHKVKIRKGVYYVSEKGVV